MGAVEGKTAGDVTGMKEKVAFKHMKPVPQARHTPGYYKKDMDGYSKIRKAAWREGDKKAGLDGPLMEAIIVALQDDGKIDSNEVKTSILPKILDGRGGKAEITCNERWTVRFALGEFDWDFDARTLLLNSMHGAFVLDPAGKAVEGDERKRIMFGPPLEELQEPPAKKGAGAEKLIYVDGIRLDKEMLLAASEGASDDSIIDAAEAIKIFQAAADDAHITTKSALTRCERWTFRFILSSYVFSDAAFNFLKEAMAKLAVNDSDEAE